MANYMEDYYDEVDSAFRKLRTSVFDAPLDDPTPQDAIFMPLGPVGWVENADGTTGEAKVIINADGITILDGKIFLSDYGGSSVLSPAGFAGSWIGFINDRVYNAQFGFGVTNTNFTVSEVSGGDTVADYSDSLSDELPYWVISARTGNMELDTDTLAAYGQAILFTGTAFDGTFYQDIPISPGHRYTVLYDIRYTADGSNTFTIEESYSWRDSTHAIIGAESTTGLGYSTNQATYKTTFYNTAEVAPANAAYLRVKFRGDRTLGSPTLNFGAVKIRESTIFGPTYMEAPNTGWQLINLKVAGEDFPRGTLSASGAIGMGDGAGTVDIFLSRRDTGEFKISGSGNTLLYVESDDDVSGFAVEDPSDTSARVFLGIGTSQVATLEFGSGSAARDVELTRTAANRIALATGDAFDQFLRFVPINRVTVFNGLTTAVSIARTLTGAISELPAEAILAVGYIDISSNGAPNNGNFLGVFQTSGGTSDFASIARNTDDSGLITTVPFTAGIVHSAGRKLSYQVGRAANTITYSLFITGYYTDTA